MPGITTLLLLHCFYGSGFRGTLWQTAASQLLEEGFELSARFWQQDATSGGYSMIENRRIQYVEDGSSAAASWVWHRVHEAPKPSLDHGTSAHGARLHRAVNGHIRQAPAAETFGNFAE